jgi:hypothetical protein
MLAEERHTSLQELVRVAVARLISEENRRVMD